MRIYPARVIDVNGSKCRVRLLDETGFPTGAVLVDVPMVSKVDAALSAVILQRHGMFDGKKRQRRTPPPTDWYLPDVANGFAELDQYDFVEDLCLEGGRLVHVFNGISLLGKLVLSCPESQMRAENTVQNLRFLQYPYPITRQQINDPTLPLT